jgi:translation initiation factor 3 subunit B
MQNAEEATHALNVMHGHPFDARHSFLISRFTDIEHFANLDEKYVEPVREEYHHKVRCRTFDLQIPFIQLLYRNIFAHGSPTRKGVTSMLPTVPTRSRFTRTESLHSARLPTTIQCVQSFSPTSTRLCCAQQTLRTELYVSWSPLGTFLATVHRQGIRLWGGPSFEHQARFFHPMVRLIDFSPNEQYIITWSNEPIVITDATPVGPQYFSAQDEGKNMAVWDIKTGNLLRTFLVSSPEGEGKKQMAWPALKWSPDDKFVARATPGEQISVYELPGMGLQGKKSMKVEGVVDFEWCPLGENDREDAGKANADGKGSKKVRENMLAYWTPEVSNQPARVTLISFPSRAILRQKNLFNVTEVRSNFHPRFRSANIRHRFQCKLYWQNQGDFLCVRVDRHTKTKKSIFCNLEIFRVREKDYPVEVVELKGGRRLYTAWASASHAASEQTRSPTSPGSRKESASRSCPATTRI